MVAAPRRPRWPRRVLFALVPAIVLFGGLELALRLLGVPEAKYLAERFEFPPAAKFGRVYQRDPVLFWRLQPGCDEAWTDYKLLFTHEWRTRAVGEVERARREREFPDRDYYRTVTWQVNQQGTRGTPPAPGRQQVLFLGSSVTFGWGVRAEDAFPGLLRERLEAAAPGRWAVVNAGVPGYSSYQALALLRRRLARERPAVVFFEAGINDGIPSTGAADADYAMARRGVVPPGLIRSSNALLLAYLASRGRPQPASAPPEPSGEPFYGVSVYQPGRSRVPPAAYLDNLAAAAELAATSGARLYVLVPALYNEDGRHALTPAARVSGPAVVELGSALAGVPAAELPSCFIPWDEAHFSRRGHALVADVLWQRLVADGVVGAS